MFWKCFGKLLYIWIQLQLHDVALNVVALNVVALIVVALNDVALNDVALNQACYTPKEETRLVSLCKLSLFLQWC